MLPASRWFVLMAPPDRKGVWNQMTGRIVSRSDQGRGGLPAQPVQLETAQAFSESRVVQGVLDTDTLAILPSSLQNHGYTGGALELLIALNEPGLDTVRVAHQ